MFRQPSADLDPIVSVTRDERQLLTAPAPPKIIIQRAQYGVLGDAKRTRDVTTKLQALIDAGEDCLHVARLAEGDDPARGIVKTVAINYTVDGLLLTATGRDSDTVRLTAAGPIELPPLDIARGLIRESGQYVFQTASGKTRLLDLALPAPQPITGPWEVSFDPKWGGPEKVTFDKLVDWSKRPEAGIKYYSGAAMYRATFQSSIHHPQSEIILDLGCVAVVAEVMLNGKPVGTLWKPPYRIDVTDAVLPGRNKLEIKVVNLWVNRQIGDEQLPEDSDRNADGTLKSWPVWLVEGKPSPAGRRTFSSWRLWKRNDQLVPSGLLGPVSIQTLERIVTDDRCVVR
jgi:hypothetical protein